jgi:hypothetical protein
MSFCAFALQLVCLVVLLFSPVHAFWKLPCHGPLVVERADPIVSPGKQSGHAHTIMGGNGFGLTETYAQARAATCSTCKVKADNSNYWVPSLYYRGQDGTVTSVKQTTGSLIYYL